MPAIPKLCSRGGSSPHPAKCAGLRHENGFTLLEVMLALAIMAGVVLTVLGAVNYHLGIIAAERDYSELTIVARYRLAELEEARKQGALPEKSEGILAPLHPELNWSAELLSTQLPGLQKLVLKVQRTSDKREVTLVRYILK